VEAHGGRGGEGIVSILAWIVVGLIAGVLAKIAMPGPDPGGIVLTIVIGIVGALIGGFIVSRLGGPDMTGINLPSILVATLGSIILLALYRLVTRRAA
jgi:uncharacterized membrane protein YeaQ/YmgE (transglycosylase-associated protein family)